MEIPYEQSQLVEFISLIITWLLINDIIILPHLWVLSLSARSHDANSLMQSGNHIHNEKLGSQDMSSPHCPIAQGETTCYDGISMKLMLLLNFRSTSAIYCYLFMSLPTFSIKKLTRVTFLVWDTLEESKAITFDINDMKSTCRIDMSWSGLNQGWFTGNICQLD